MIACNADVISQKRQNASFLSRISDPVYTARVLTPIRVEIMHHSCCKLCHNWISIPIPITYQYPRESQNNWEIGYKHIYRVVQKRIPSFIFFIPKIKLRSLFVFLDHPVCIFLTGVSKHPYHLVGPRHCSVNPTQWQWRHFVCCINRRHVGGIPFCGNMTS